MMVGHRRLLTREDGNEEINRLLCGRDTKQI